MGRADFDRGSQHLRSAPFKLLAFALERNESDAQNQRHGTNKARGEQRNRYATTFHAPLTNAFAHLLKLTLFGLSTGTRIRFSPGTLCRVFFGLFVGGTPGAFRRFKFRLLFGLGALALQGLKPYLFFGFAPGAGLRFSLRPLHGIQPGHLSSF